jgi:phage shock protein PspC (stress-responsive transcriptional regulator)
MNKILNINLGGYAITIDEDAYEFVDGYLQNIKSRFSESDGRDEIIRDVEARLGELITMGLGNRSIVMLPDVKAAVEVLGTPEDFGGEPTAAQQQTQARTKNIYEQTVKSGKRLFRDEQDAQVAGVCSGLSAYFGVKDPVWMRLIFILLALTTGIGVLVYFVFWIIVPPAITTAERLEMRGEEINVDTIARELEQSNERIKKSAGPAAKGCMSIIGWLGMAFLIFISVILLLILGGFWIGSTVSLVALFPYVPFFSPFSTGWTWLLFLCASLVLLSPIIGILTWMSGLLFKTKSPSWLKSGLSVGWVAGFLGLIFFTIFGVTKYQDSTSITRPLDTSSFNNDTLEVSFVGDNDDNWNDGDFRLNDRQLQMRAWLDIQVSKSQNNNFYVNQVITARGSSSQNAQQNAEGINYQVTLEGNKLLIPRHVVISPDNKFRGQNIDIKIQIPIGKYVVFGPQVSGHVEYRGNHDDNNYYYRGIETNQVYQMTDEGLQCVGCPRFGDRGYRDDRHYEKFTLEGDFDTEIRRGDDFSIEIEGKESDKALLKNIRTGDELTLTTQGQKLTSKMKVVIFTRVFTRLFANNTGEVIIRGFDEHHSEITAKGSTTKVRGDFESNELEVRLSNNATLELNGKGQDLDASVTDGAILDANAWRVETVDVQANVNSKAKINARQNAKVKQDASSDIQVSGGAEIERDQE